MFLNDSILLDSYEIIVGIIVIISTFFKWKFTYWSSRNVPQLPASSPFGSIENPITATKSMDLQIADLYKAHKARGDKYAGFYMFTTPSFLVLDPELIKRILTKDFSHFVDHSLYHNEIDDPLSAHLVALKGEKWRDIRAKITPAFSSGKMKSLLPLIVESGKPLIEEIAMLADKKEPLDIKELVASFTINIIGSCAFGMEIDSFKDSEFLNYGKIFFKIDFKQSILRIVGRLFPSVLQKLRVKLINEDLSRFFVRLVEEIIDSRKKSECTRKDLMQLLVDLKERNEITLNQLSAQALIFFEAGFETSSTTLTFCLYELARNQEIQETLRNEINEVLEKNDGNITYKCLNEMHYLEQVINESLRMYPPFPMIDRTCTEPYKIPGTDLVLEKGTNIFASNYAMQHDAKLFPNPECFDPDRFAEENRDNITSYTYLPFGEGPRKCIAGRFALMEIKMGLITILRNFKLKVNVNSPKVVTYDPKSIVLASVDPIYLDAEKIIA